MSGNRNADVQIGGNIGKIPIIVNSAMPNPNVPNANAIRLFFIRKNTTCETNFLPPQK